MDDEPSDSAQDGSEPTQKKTSTTWGGIGTVVGAVILWNLYGYHLTQDGRFLHQMHQNQYGAGASDSAMVEDAHAICAGLDTGETLYQIASSSSLAGMTPDQRGYLVGAGVAHYCPSHNQYVMSQVGGQ